eukprot:CAMPEP_0117667888 /NCGR_PEP_ID=MMETSP0804-20121206/11225_1 /TAXON_ID=1074897 /ORGANISM="Tetraselmis astigmatica, Strain CCMP880" /LENGTH=109 /DNA_ID=CAMNT_0005475681 /DNA_START=318 /DNA_END=648 /DNA_ORIENTATION=+
MSDLGDRVSMLKNITKGIQDEVHSQHTILDNMGVDMSGARNMLGGTVDRLGKVMENASNKKILTITGGIVVAFLLLYFFSGDDNPAGPSGNGPAELSCDWEEHKLLTGS